MLPEAGGGAAFGKQARARTVRTGRAAAKAEFAWQQVVAPRRTKEMSTAGGLAERASPVEGIAVVAVDAHLAAVRLVEVVSCAAVAALVGRVSGAYQARHIAVGALVLLAELSERAGVSAQSHIISLQVA